MTRKRIIALFGIMGLAALILTAPWNIVAGGHDDDDNRPRRCKPGGAYTGKDPGGCTWNQTIVPCDPASNRMTGVVKFANISPVGPGFPLFPDTEFRTDLVANMVRTGRNTWDFTWIGYGVEKPEDAQAYPGYAWPLTFIMVSSGRQTFTDGGDDVAVDFTSVKIWEVDTENGIDPDVNPADGFPDIGVVPTYSFLPPGAVYTETATRFPVVPH
ncbi:hypothetical protein HQ563_18975 [bacterium]|nr:hypothetical protein [bacterium]